MADAVREQRFIGIEEAAHILGMSYSAVWESLRRGDFPAPYVQVGKRWRISRAGLEALAEQPAEVDRAFPRRSEERWLARR